jgi:hypothetical protein
LHDGVGPLNVVEVRVTERDEDERALGLDDEVDDDVSKRDLLR